MHLEGYVVASVTDSQHLSRHNNPRQRLHHILRDLAAIDAGLAGDQITAYV